MSGNGNGIVGQIPDLVWTDLPTPPSSESESHEAFFVPPLSLPRPAQKLRKLAHPPPSFHTFSAALSPYQSGLSFVADEPPSSEHSNFPFIFAEPTGRRSTAASLGYERNSRSQSDFGHSYPYLRSLSSMPDSSTPILRPLSSFGHRSTPTRKLTKPRPAVNNKPLPVPEPKSLPMPPPTPPPKPVDAPKRRPSISFAFTVALKRRLSMPKGKPKQEQETEQAPRTPHKARSSPHVGSPTALLSKPKGETGEKHLPSPPAPTPPAKESISPSRVSLSSSPPPLSSCSKLRKERKDKSKKFSIGGDDDDVSVIPPTHTHYPSEPLPPPSSFVYDLSTDLSASSNKVLPATPRLRPPIVRRELAYEGGSSSIEASGSGSSRTQRRWTLALAMTSDDLTDEVFVEKVERIRRDSVRGEAGKSVEGVGGFRGWEFGYLDPDSSDGSEDENEEDDYETFEGFDVRDTSAYPSMADLARPTSNMPSNSTSMIFPSRPASVMTLGLPRTVSSTSHQPPSNADPAKAWSSALHALLITRDLLRTERNYLDQLKVLLSSSPCVMTPAAQTIAETSLLWGDVSPLSSSGMASTSGLLNLASISAEKFTASASSSLPWPVYPPPSLMHTYLLSLIAMSISLLREWEKDPTVAGVGRVLVEKEEEIERVFVGWCGVIGGWFTEDASGKKSKTRKNAEEGGLDEKKRRRRLSKTKFSSSPASVTVLSSPSQTNKSSVSTSMPSSTPPTAFHSSSLTPNTIATQRPVTRSSTMNLAMSKWRKSMPNVPHLADLGLTINTQQLSSSTLATREPKSAGPRVAGFKSRETEQPAPPKSISKEVVEVPQASTFVTVTEIGRNGMEQERGDLEEGLRGRGRDKDLATPDVPRSRSHGMLPRMIRYEKISSSNTSERDATLPNGGMSTEFVDSNGRKIHSVRELGILPVQRVTRYALLFRDLLKRTPETSPSRPLLEKAAEAAARIAAKCDKAQGNAEIFFSGTSASRKMV